MGGSQSRTASEPFQPTGHHHQSKEGEKVCVGLRSTTISEMFVHPIGLGFVALVARFLCVPGSLVGINFFFDIGPVECHSLLNPLFVYILTQSVEVPFENV